MLLGGFLKVEVLVLGTLGVCKEHHKRMRVRTKDSIGSIISGIPKYTLVLAQCIGFPVIKVIRVGVRLIQVDQRGTY